jgi:hypothetical protein
LLGEGTEVFEKRVPRRMSGSKRETAIRGNGKRGSWGVFSSHQISLR